MGEKRNEFGFTEEEMEIIDNFPYKIFEGNRTRWGLTYEVCYPSKIKEGKLRRVARVNKTDLQREILAIVANDDVSKGNITANMVFPYVSEKMNKWNYKITCINGVWTASYKSKDGTHKLITSVHPEEVERKCIEVMENGEFVPRWSRMSNSMNRKKMSAEEFEEEKDKDLRDSLKSCTTTDFSFYMSDTIEKLNSFSTEEELKEMLSDVNYKLYMKISRHPNATAEILKSLTKTGIPAVTKNIARNANTAPETLLYIARISHSAAVWKLLIENPNFPEEAFDFIPLDKKKEIERAIAVSPTIPIDILHDLAVRTTDNEILSFILANENTSSITAKYIWRLPSFEDKKLAEDAYLKKKAK